MLTAEQHRLRDGRVTASFAPALMAGDEARILSEWQRLVGSADYREPDFSANWPVRLGEYLEPLALDWHQARTGHALTRRGEVANHPSLAVCATLDCWREADDRVIDCKVVGAWRKIDDVCAHYTPQLIVQQACAPASNAALLIVHGGAEPAEHAVEWGAEYEADVWGRIVWFLECVESLTPPVAVAPIAASVKAERVADMRESNAWAEHAAAWLANCAAAKLADKAAKELRALVPADAARAHGHGVSVSRDKAGRLSIKGMAA